VKESKEEKSWVPARTREKRKESSASFGTNSKIKDTNFQRIFFLKKKNPKPSNFDDEIRMKLFHWLGVKIGREVFLLSFFSLFFWVMSENQIKRT
jgi:hypothetical protein